MVLQCPCCQFSITTDLPDPTGDYEELCIRLERRDRKRFDIFCDSSGEVCLGWGHDTYYATTQRIIDWVSVPSGKTGRVTSTFWRTWSSPTSPSTSSTQNTVLKCMLEILRVIFVSKPMLEFSIVIFALLPAAALRSSRVGPNRKR